MAKGKFQKWLEPDGLLLLAAWARDGLTDEQIAHNCGLKSASTLYDWKNRFPEISEALKRGKEVVDIEVENALLKRAKGYEYTEEKVEVETRADGTPVSRKVVQTVKQVAPDVGAAAFWLKNRLPKKYRDHPLEDSNTEEFNHNIQSLAELIKSPAPNRNIDDIEKQGEKEK